MALLSLDITSIYVNQSIVIIKNGASINQTSKILYHFPFLLKGPNLYIGKTIRSILINMIEREHSN